jgi:TonB-linked SusC/RagA family outer membrane protein
MKSLTTRLLTLVAVLAAMPVALAAQQTTITGRVVSSDSTPLPGVIVAVPDLRVGGHTDPQGRYSFVAPAGSAGRVVIITAKRLGSKPDSARIEISGATVTRDFVLTAQVTVLTGVVVTALGIEKDKSQLGTAQQQISAEDLNVTKTMNLIQQVQGKMAGVAITGAGTPGGSVMVSIRGQNTLASNNQPLYIVDGVPVSNSNRGGSFVNGYDFGNAISDLNPEDIEALTVLKGPNAAAIYGSRAQNGVIVITTKKGLATGGRMRTEVSTLFQFDGPGRLPDFQNQYGQGAGGSFSYVDGAGGGDCDGCDQSWGPKLDVGTLLCQFNSPGAGTASCTPTPWVSHPNNVKDFFKTGLTRSMNVAVAGGTDRANARMSVGVDNVDGYVPNNFFQKTSGMLSGALQVNPKLSTNAMLQYTRNNGKNRPGTGYLNSIMEQFFWFGRQVDMAALKDWRQLGATNGGPASREYNWNYNYHNNPYYQQEANNISDARDRFIVQGTAKYQFATWLNASVTSGSDIFKFNIDQKFDPAFLNGSFVNQAYAGGFNFVQDYRNEHNTSLLVNVNRDLTSDLVVYGTVGGNVRREYLNTNSVATTGLSVAGIYNVSNAAVTPTLGQFTSRRDMNSMFGSASATFRGYLTVEATGRNDISSTLPKGENSFFYPSVNMSYVLSDAVSTIQNDVLSFLKVRGSWARVGNDADPYQLATTFAGNPNKFGGRPQFSLGNGLLAPNLKPEITESMEAGTEIGLFKGRANLDLTWYKKNTSNQIYLVPVSATTGYSSKLLNAGEMENTGIEMLATITPVKMNGWNWTTTFNYGTNTNKVVSLEANTERIILGNGLFGDVRLEATKGKPYGALWGYDLRRCDANAVLDGMCTAGQTGKLLTDGGIPIQTDTMVYLGSIQPKWTGGWNNEVTWKNYSFGMLLDIKSGGKIMSYTNYVGQYSGVLKTSLRGREVDWDNPGVWVDGIDINTATPNVDTVTSEAYHQNLFGATGQTTYDASYIKLRELRFGYEVPSNITSKLRVTSMSISLTGRNLWLSTDVPNVDPEFAYSSGNFQGIEYALPGNAKSWGINVRFTP